jgi:hypothetical protein
MLYLCKPSWSNPTPEENKINMDYISKENAHHDTKQNAINNLGSFLTNQLDVAIEKYNSIIDQYISLKEAFPKPLEYGLPYYPISQIFDIESRNEKYNI